MRVGAQGGMEIKAFGRVKSKTKELVILNRF